jgi:hypothetical protein
MSGCDCLPGPRPLERTSSGIPDHAAPITRTSRAASTASRVTTPSPLISRIRPTCASRRCKSRKWHRPSQGRKGSGRRAPRRGDAGRIGSPVSVPHIQGAWGRGVRGPGRRPPRRSWRGDAEERRTHLRRSELAALPACPIPPAGQAAPGLGDKLIDKLGPPQRTNRAGRARPPPLAGSRHGPSVARSGVVAIRGSRPAASLPRAAPLRRPPAPHATRGVPSAWLRGAEEDARPGASGREEEEKGARAPGASAPSTGRCRGGPSGGDLRGIVTSPPGGHCAKAGPEDHPSGPVAVLRAWRIRPERGPSPAERAAGPGPAGRAARSGRRCLQAVPGPSHCGLRDGGSAARVLVGHPVAGGSGDQDLHASAAPLPRRFQISMTGVSPASSVR